MCISGQVSVVSRFQIIHRQYALFSPYKPYSYSVNQHFKFLLHSMAGVYSGDLAKFTTQILQIISIFSFGKLQVFILLFFVSQITASPSIWYKTYGQVLPSELSSYAKKTLSCKEPIMSKDKYTSIQAYFCVIWTLLCSISFKYFCSTWA